MYESVRLTRSTHAGCEIECPVYVGVFGRWVSLLQTAEVRVWLDAHPTPGIRLDTKASSVMTGATKAAVHI